MTTLSAVANTLRTAADTLPITLLGEATDATEEAATTLALATTGTTQPELIQAVATFTDAYQQAQQLLLQAIALRDTLHAIANRLAAPTTPSPPPPHPPARVDQIRRSLPRRPEGSETQGRWLGPGTDVTVLRSGKGDEWYDKALAFIKGMGGRGRVLMLATHVEVKLAVRMREERRTQETVIIDRQVCGRRETDSHLANTCDKQLKHILPPGTTLTVVEHDGTRVVYRGEE
ncbi:DddA-like double-stranded DNA deaminase toxin [Actinosynnema sp. CS-041913]|uniref:DddA-like double-stranded DNA deaminase toxin n=1 Tax=Actinosynnema sp. CS-041913 TaxID=3239917 RepID=UPI003D909DFA